MANDYSTKPSMIEVDELADHLCSLYDNSSYRKWYCRVIYELGVNRVKTLVAMCSDAKEPAKLFTKRANAELKAKLNKERLQIEKDLHKGKFGL